MNEFRDITGNQIVPGNRVIFGAGGEVPHLRIATVKSVVTSKTWRGEEAFLLLNYEIESRGKRLNRGVKISQRDSERNLFLYQVK